MFIRLLLTLLLSGAASLYAANPPSEFLDIPWAASVADAKRIMLQRPGLALKSETPPKLIFEGGTFANYPAERYELELAEGRLLEGTVFVVIPPGKHKDGAPLRNHQFEELYRSLSAKYGKGARTGDGKHTESNWKWTVSDARTGQRRDIAILLSYSWEPYEFIVRYSNRPAVQATPRPKAPKQKDL